jgi:hypothetical protein
VASNSASPYIATGSSTSPTVIPTLMLAPSEAR